jgi:methionyl aminopeptidase
MIRLKTLEEIALMQQSCLLVGEAHAAVVPHIKPGMTTMRINDLVEEFILDHQATPSFKNYHGYPFATCISVNEAVVHGFPGNYALKDGDIISLDIGVFKHGFHGDSAYTYALAGVDPAVMTLLKVTKESLYLGIEQARSGNRVGDISFAIQEHTERKHGYGVVRELVGHGLGRELHEDPQVPNYGKRGSGPQLKPGMVLAIEPMINLGTRALKQLEDGWTVITKDRKPSAHFEHDVCITTSDPYILSSFEALEVEERKNPNLVWSHGDLK